MRNTGAYLSAEAGWRWDEREFQQHVPNEPDIVGDLQLGGPYVLAGVHVLFDPAALTP